MATLKKSVRWYNPLFLIDGKEIRELKDIVFFKDGEVVFRTGKGWFDYGNNRMEENEVIEIGEVKKKIKEDLNVDFIFWKPKAKEYYEVHNKYNHAVLFIPFKEDEWKITKEGRSVEFPTKKVYYDVYESEKWKCYQEIKSREEELSDNMVFIRKCEALKEKLKPFLESIYFSDTQINENTLIANRQQIEIIMKKLEV